MVIRVVATYLPTYLPRSSVKMQSVTNRYLILWTFSNNCKILQQIKAKNNPSSIRRRDSNSWPFDCQSPAITTRPTFTVVCFNPPHPLLDGKAEPKICEIFLVRAICRNIFITFFTFSFRRIFLFLQQFWLMAWDPL